MNDLTAVRDDCASETPLLGVVLPELGDAGATLALTRVCLGCGRERTVRIAWAAAATELPEAP